MTNLMALAIAIIQPCKLAFPESMMHTIAITKGGRWIEAWERRLLRTLGTECFEDAPDVSNYSPLKPFSDDKGPSSNAVPSTDMPNLDYKSFRSVSQHSNVCKAQVRNTSTPLNVGCAPASRSNASNKHQAVASLPSPESSTNPQQHSCPENDMIGGPVANSSDCVPGKLCVGSRFVCEEDSESVSIPPVCSCLSCEEDKDNDVLLEFRLDGKNIVLDSVCPHIAPHIVITPPISYADDFYTPNNNRVDLQWPCFLSVPPLSSHVFHHYRPLPHDDSVDRDSKRFESQSEASADEFGGLRPEDPLRVFNHQKFLSTVEYSSTERLIFREVVNGISRHRHKAAAFEASLSGPAACARFNAQVAASNLEQPFVWTDPAQPILRASRYFSGISILESDNPFRAPHIMITDAPPHDPWISFRNGNREEDQDFDYLSPYPKRKPSPPPNNSALEAVPLGPPLHHGHPEASHSNYSREPHLIDTPLSLDVTGRFLMPCELGCGSCSDHPRHTSDVNACSSSFEDMSVCRSVIRCDFTTDLDEEDDLPPFDDWYLAVIERSKVRGA